MDDVTRTKVQKFLMANEGITKAAAAIVATSVITKESVEDVFTECMIMIRAKIESSKSDGTLDRLNKIDEMLDTILNQ